MQSFISDSNSKSKTTFSWNLLTVAQGEILTLLRFGILYKTVLGLFNTNEVKYSMQGQMQKGLYQEILLQAGSHHCTQEKRATLELVLMKAWLYPNVR